MQTPFRVALVDKNPLICAALQQVFDEDERFILAGAMQDGAEFLDFLKKTPCDVAIIGWELTSVTGEQILKTLALRRRNPATIIYAGNTDSDIPRQAMILGAAGYCSKQSELTELLSIVETVARGKMVFPRININTLFYQPFAELTKREHEVLLSIVDGATNKEIAGTLTISPNTVKFHLKNLYEKLNVSNRAQAISFYYSVNIKNNTFSPG